MRECVSSAQMFLAPTPSQPVNCLHAEPQLQVLLHQCQLVASYCLLNLHTATLNPNTNTSLAHL